MFRTFLSVVAMCVWVAGCSCNNRPPGDCGDAGCLEDGGSNGAAGGVGPGGTGGGDTPGSAGGDAGGSAAGGEAGGGSGVSGGQGGAGGSSSGGGSSGGTAPSGGGAGAVDAGAADVCDEIARRECDFFIRCVASGSVFGGTTTNRVNAQVPASQRAVCESSRKERCQQLQAGAARGRLSINALALRQCLDAAFPVASCTREQNVALTACDDSSFVTPLGANGALCTSNNECAQGYCQRAPQQDCGSCRPYANDGGAFSFCGNDNPCAPGTYCRNAMCAPYAGVDAGCGGFNPECAPGFTCAGSGLNRVCQRQKAEGESCVKGREECLRTTDAVQLVCATLAGGIDRCVKRYNVLPRGICNSGETIDGVTGPNCLDTEYCNAGLCELKRTQGQPCGDMDDTCEFGTRCSQNMCTAYRDVGQSCTNSGQCKALLSCAGGGIIGGMGTCQPSLAPVGGACQGFGNDSPDCVFGAYCPFMPGGMPMCMPSKPNGQTCSQDDECSGGSCNLGMCANACWK
jgi:hypothetical protein